MNLGQTIKYYRLKRGMTQANLALGICSISHLSKIENGAYDVNHDTATQLLKRLGVDIEAEKATYERLKHTLDTFNEAIQFADMNEAHACADTLAANESTIIRTTFLYTYHLYMMRYHLLNEAITRAEQQRQILLKNQSSLTPCEMAIYTLFYSLLLIAEHRFSEAKQHLLDLRKKATYTAYTPIQDVDFALSRCYTALHEPDKAIIHAKDALRIFKQTDNYVYTFNTQLLLGINYTNMNMIEDAIKLYQTLLRNTRLFSQQALYYKTIYHYGLLLKKTYRYQESYQYLSDCLDFFEKSSEYYCHCLLSIAQVCTHLSMKHKQIDHMLQKVIALSTTHHFPHLSIQARYTLLRLHNSNDIDHFIEEVMLPYFNQTDHAPDLVPYAIELAESYQNKGQYERANAILNRYVTQIKSWKKSPPSPVS